MQVIERESSKDAEEVKGREENEFKEKNEELTGRDLLKPVAKESSIGSEDKISHINKRNTCINIGFDQEEETMSESPQSGNQLVFPMHPNTPLHQHKLESQKIIPSPPLIVLNPLPQQQILTVVKTRKARIQEFYTIFYVYIYIYITPYRNLMPFWLLLSLISLLSHNQRGVWYII